MAKVAPDAMIAGGLTYVQECDLMVMCSAQPATYAEATATYDLADVALSTPADLVIADGTSGRKITIAQKLAVAVDHTGNITHIVLCKVADTTLRYITTTTSAAVVSGETVDVPAWSIQIGDPT
jgi:hypothetical protein